MQSGTTRLLRENSGCVAKRLIAACAPCTSSMPPWKWPAITGRLPLKPTRCADDRHAMRSPRTCDVHAAAERRVGLQNIPAPCAQYRNHVTDRNHSPRRQRNVDRAAQLGERGNIAPSPAPQKRGMSQSVTCSAGASASATVYAQLASSISAALLIVARTARTRCASSG